MTDKSIVEIVEPNELMTKIADDSLFEMRQLFPTRTIELVGAMAVPMSGRREIDIMITSPDVLGDSEVINKTNHSAGPTIDRISYFRKFVDDIEVDVQIVPEDHAMVDIHRGMIEKLKSDSELREKYSKFKHGLAGLPFDEYKVRKSAWVKENLL